MLKEITTDSNTENIEQVLRKYGVARIPDFLDNSIVDHLLQEVKEVLAKEINYLNPLGHCSRYAFNSQSNNTTYSRDLTEGSHLASLPECFEKSRYVLNDPSLQTLVKNYLGEHSGYMDIAVFTRDFKPNNKAVYGKLHFDRRHQLKFIFYLNDVEKSNGPFACIPGSHNEACEKYYKEWGRILGLDPENKAEVDRQSVFIKEDDPRYLTLNCIFEGDEYYEKNKMLIVGTKGTLVVFDTHIVHAGGVVEEGFERWTLKGHTFVNV